MKCKDCKYRDAVWFAHDPDENCTDVKCQETNHEAQCGVCMSMYIHLIDTICMSKN